MILYHYTLAKNLGSHDGSAPGIMRDGLLPRRWVDCPHADVTIPETVWFTEQREGVPAWWIEQDPEHLRGYCRIKAAIPASDRRLMSYADFLRALGVDGDLREFMKHGGREHWVYFGKVGLSKFRAIELCGGLWVQTGSKPSEVAESFASAGSLTD